MNLELKENSSTILLSVTDNDADFKRCDFAVVTFSKELVERLIELKKARDLVGCYEVSAFYGCVEFLNQDEFAHESDEESIEEELSDKLEKFTNYCQGVWNIEPVNLSDIPMIRTETDLVHVSEYGVKFTAMMKFSGVEFCTEKVSWEQIEAMVL